MKPPDWWREQLQRPGARTGLETFVCTWPRRVPEGWQNDLAGLELEEVHVYRREVSFEAMCVLWLIPDHADAVLIALTGCIRVEALSCGYRVEADPA